jgi:hypothetical protein
MKQSLETAFPQIIQNRCLEFTSKQDFYIFDEENKSSKITETGILQITNPRASELGFLKIDHCFLGNKDPNKCDCAVFDENTFCFVEISVAKAKQRNEKRRKATEQLSNTIKLFKEKGISYKNRKLEAVMVFDFEKTYPARTSSNLEAQKLFVDECNAVLKEGNALEF